MIKKVFMVVGLITVSMLGMESNVEATSTAQSELGFNVSSDGELEILAARPVSFGDIKYSPSEQVLYPRIENIHEYTTAFNPTYIPSKTNIVGGGMGFSLVDVSDARIGGGNWELWAGISSAINDETGDFFDVTLELSHFANLFAGGNDSRPVSPYFISSESGYEMVYSGGQGAYALSIFEDFKYIEKDSKAIQPGIVTTDKMALIIPPNTKVSDKGTYSVSILWSLSDTPSAIPVQ